MKSKLLHEFTPAFISSLKQGITRDQLIKDILAGVVVGIVALPLAIAFAIASGVSPEKGLITAVVGGFIISAMGGSRVQIGGPTGAFIVLVLAIVREHGVDGLIVATIMAGLIILLMGLLRLGKLLKFIPYPLVVGFTSGIAVVIFSTQIKDFFGMAIQDSPHGFFAIWSGYVGGLHSANYHAAGVALFTVLVASQLHRISAKLPASFVALLLATVVVQVFNLPLQTIGSRFGDLSLGLPMPHLPVVSMELIRSLLGPAMAIAVLGSIESLLSAVVADGMIGGRHKSNAELVGQGVANIASGLFGGIPATGAIARTATNIRSGARTPIAGIVHALTLLLIMLFLAPLAKLIPMAALAGVLVVVAYNMSEWRQFVVLLRGKRGDALVMVTTFLLTVVFDLIIAIQMGMILSAFILMERMSENMRVRRTDLQGITKEPCLGEIDEEAVDASDAEKFTLFEQELENLPQGVVLYEISGPLFFGAAQEFQDILMQMHKDPKLVILRMRYVTFIDATGLYRLQNIIRNFHNHNIQVIISGVSKSLKADLRKGNITKIVDPLNITSSIQGAVKRATKLLTTV
jgi:sulfate permease, SulP family